MPRYFLAPTHDELVTAGGAYAALWRAQNAERKSAPVLAAGSAA